MSEWCNGRHTDEHACQFCADDWRKRAVESEAERDELKKVNAELSKLVHDRAWKELDRQFGEGYSQIKSERDALKEALRTIEDLVSDIEPDFVGAYKDESKAKKASDEFWKLINEVNHERHL